MEDNLDTVVDLDQNHPVQYVIVSSSGPGRHNDIVDLDENHPVH